MTGHLARRGQKSWRLKFDTGRDPTSGKRVTKYATLHGTKAQAQAQATKILASALEGTFVDASAETVANFVERWLRDWADNNVSHKTWTRYAQLLRKHVAARIGAVPIQKLRAADLQSIYTAMAKDGLADRTRLHTHRVIFTMLKHATQWGIVARNVASLVDTPRVQAREVEILTPDQAQTVMEMLHDRPLYSIVAVALGSGLRRSELLALRWHHVDLNAGRLQVEQALEQTKRGGLVFRSPKTRYGRRPITLAPSTVAVLRAHWKAQQEQRLALGLGRVDPSSLVFASLDGSPRSPNALTKEWQLAMRKAGFRATFHSLRHTHASTLIASGLDVLTISRRLGHGSPSITLGVYGHLFKTDDRAAAIIEAALTRLPK